MYVFKTSGVCSKEIRFEIEDDIIKSVEFVGGCPGNLIGIKSLVEGSTVDEVIEKLKGIPCGVKSTSCPDQFTKALELYKKKRNEQ
ncbi:TIGR03905 family TSCPD domain-containing protein [Tepidibacter hydrothermalis]|uniref:ribonucleoside-diphosphate reductase n=1 Tax=Tepidibacter hydrothermalis TaxID=3036126 RepID=A0ABY8EE57_9FIRM|nr:TIGR03905 family TSCPD domain-containing protein [Tepidibacter hydrothermalis]WFD11225.1 TIGR03905 family TSCPD domain-containing protein [Tepidibacter hydrothermalis]